MQIQKMHLYGSILHCATKSSEATKLTRTKEGLIKKQGQEHLPYIQFIFRHFSYQDNFANHVFVFILAGF